MQKQTARLSPPEYNSEIDPLVDAVKNLVPITTDGRHDQFEVEDIIDHEPHRDLVNNCVNVTRYYVKLVGSDIVFPINYDDLRCDEMLVKYWCLRAQEEDRRRDLVELINQQQFSRERRRLELLRETEMREYDVRREELARKSYELVNRMHAERVSSRNRFNILRE